MSNSTRSPNRRRSAFVRRALELSLLVEGADDALAAGSIDVARTAYVTALERAPRHPELSRAVAEIDARIGGRAQAALGLLIESLPATQAGLIGAELLARAGDAQGARDAVEAAARHEPFAPLSAWYFRKLAELEVEAPERVHALDRAVAHAPGLAEVRWARFEERATRGDVEGAVADAEHLEAIERRARAPRRLPPRRTPLARRRPRSRRGAAVRARAALRARRRDGHGGAGARWSSRGARSERCRCSSAPWSCLRARGGSTRRHRSISERSWPITSRICRRRSLACAASRLRPTGSSKRATWRRGGVLASAIAPARRSRSGACARRSS